MEERPDLVDDSFTLATDDPLLRDRAIDRVVDAYESASGPRFRLGQWREPGHWATDDQWVEMRVL